MKEPLPFLLTGANGFLGKMILAELKKQGSVTTLGWSAGNNCQVDLAQTVPNVSEGFHMVVHNAGKAHLVPRNEVDAKAFYQVNYEGTRHLLQGLERAPILPKQFIFISTVAVYGVEQGTNIDENYPLKGATPYAKSKIQAEQLVIEWCNKHGVSPVILRLPLVVGANPPGNLGAMCRAIQRGYYIQIVGNTARKSAVLGSDVAKLIAGGLIGKQGIYNLADGVHPRFVDIEQALAKAYGKKIVFRIPATLLTPLAKMGDVMATTPLPFPLTTKRLEKMTGTLTFSDARACQELGWQPQPVLSFLEQMDS